MKIFSKVMLGGAWFDEYLKNKGSNEIISLAFGEIRKHLNIKVDPDYQDIAILKVKFFRNLQLFI